MFTGETTQHVQLSAIRTSFRFHAGRWSFTTHSVNSIGTPSAAYIGKTVNTVYERFFVSGTGHLAPNYQNSALLDHLVSAGDPNYDFVFIDVQILDLGAYDEQIRFIESIMLKQTKFKYA